MNVIGDNQVHIADDQTDLVGMRTVTLYQNWIASTWPLTLEQLDVEEPAVPAVPAGLWLIGRQRRRVGGVLRTFWTFEGINGSGKDITFKTRGNSPDYGFTPGFADVVMQQHPRISKMLDQYEGQVIDDQIIWPRTYGEDAKPNPLFGRSTYFAFQGGVYFYRYMVRSASELPDIIGKLFTGGLPGEVPKHTNRNWLCAGVPWKKRGPAAIEAMELYWLSDEGGWPKAIYSKGGGGSDAPGFGAGLSLGSIQPAS